MMSEAVGPASVTIAAVPGQVGLARAFVARVPGDSHPDADVAVLLASELAFSALDVLTSENLRNELITLWAQPGFPTRCVCIVTHNIEEAVLLADRVLVLGSNPGHIKAEVPVRLPRPRDRRSRTFEAMVDQLYGILTGRDEKSAAERAAVPGPLSHPLPGGSTRSRALTNAQRAASSASAGAPRPKSPSGKSDQRADRSHRMVLTTRWPAGRRGACPPVAPSGS